MDITFDVKVVDLRNTQKEVSRAGEVFGSAGYQCGDGAEGVEAIRDINSTLFCVGGFACARVHRFGNRMNVVNDVAMGDSIVRVGVKADELMMERVAKGSREARSRTEQKALAAVPPRKEEMADAY